MSDLRFEPLIQDYHSMTDAMQRLASALTDRYHIERELGLLTT